MAVAQRKYNLQQSCRRMEGKGAEYNNNAAQAEIHLTADRNLIAAMEGSAKALASALHPCTHCQNNLCAHRADFAMLAVDERS